MLPIDTQVGRGEEDHEPRFSRSSEHGKANAICRSVDVLYEQASELGVLD